MLVAADFEARGYEVDLRGTTGDWGIDIIATTPDERLAIQAKMYARARPVNRRQVFELYGASRYFDCTGAVLATDGEFNPDALDAADRLGVQIWRPGKLGTKTKQRGVQPRELPTRVSSVGPALPTFEELWERRVVPLVGKTLSLSNGGTNRITAADWGGIKRVTSTGRRGSIPIEPFVWAIQRIRDHGSVSRVEINDQFEGRHSSGVALILAQIPELELVGSTTAFRIRDSNNPGISGG
jgi:restriction system protein